MRKLGFVPIKLVTISIKSGDYLKLENISSRRGVRWTTDSPKLLSIEGSCAKLHSIREWGSNKEYRPQDIVEYAGVIYECVEGGISGKTRPIWDCKPAAIKRDYLTSDRLNLITTSIVKQLR